VESFAEDILPALVPVVEALERLGIPYHVGGSVASSIHGLPRSTVDIDLVANIELGQVAELVSRLEDAYYVDLEAARQAVRQRRSFNLIHLHSAIKLDIFVPEHRPFDEQEHSRARLDSLDPAEGARQFFVKSPEDLILRKLLWYRAGGEVSERQWNDVLGILKVQAAGLDHGYLREWAAQLGVTDLLDHAFAAAVGQ
jgi:hypothetical protein